MRTWEFPLGGAAFFRADAAQLRGWRRQWHAALGLAAIAPAASTLTPGVGYPGIIALLPCAGAGLLKPLLEPVFE